MIKIDYYNCYGSKGNGYELSLFPLITISKTNWIKYNEYDVIIGFWFWSMEISWSKTK